MSGGVVRPLEGSAVGRSTVASLALCGVMAALLAVGSWVSIPLYPVPLTLQTLVVLVAGGLLGRAFGPVSTVVYVLVGLVGVPVFAGGEAGPGVLLGPKGGYLVGFVLAAFVMGWAGDATRAARRAPGVSRLPRWWRLALGAVVASLLIYAAGVPWLAAVTGMGWRAAVTVGMLPFLIGDAVKAAVAVAVIRAVDDVLAGQGLRR